MVSLGTLQLCGIRSFSPADGHVQEISFDEGPVTFLVGQNGSGKTTILEAIKYALTGELPTGTSKGQGFVHDPNLLKKNAVKGFVKLTLSDMKGDTYMISRTVQLMRKGNSLSFSSVDSSISIVRANGDKQKLSGRCADIDKNCIEILKISPSILNSVLFCHQEHSSWPLDEGKKVKEKFDEIFDTQKYNRVIIKFQERIKEHTEKYKKLQMELDYLKSVKEDVSRKRDNLFDKQNRLSAIEEEIIQKRENVKPQRERLNELLELENKIGDLEKQLASTQTENKGIRQQIDTLKNQITDLYQGTDEELQTEIETFERKQMEKEQKIRVLEQKINALVKSENENEQNINKSQMKLGQLKEERKQMISKCEAQTKYFEEVMKTLGVSENLSWNETEKCRYSMNKLNTKIKELDTNFDKLITEKQSEEKKAQGKVDKFREIQARSKGNLATIRENITKTKEKIANISNQIHELEVTNTELVKVNRKLETLNNELTKIQSKHDANATNSKISELKKQISEMEKKLEEYEELYRTSQQNYITDEKINSELQLKLKKQSESRKILNKRSNEFKKIFRENLPEQNIKRTIQRNITTNEDEIKRINREISTKQIEITKAEAKVDHITRDITSQENELKLKTSQIDSVCQGQDFTTLQEKTFKTREILLRNKGEYRSAKIMYEKFIRLFEKEEKPCCPICETDFTRKRSAVEEITSKLRQKIVNIPETLSEVETKLNSEEELYNKLQQLEPLNKDIAVISNVKLPLLNEQLEENRSYINSLNKDLKKLEVELKNPTETVEICRNILSDATLLDQYSSDIKVCEEKIKELEGEKINVETNMSKHEIEMEISNIKSDINEKRSQSDSLRRKLDQQKQTCDDINERIRSLYKTQMEFQSKMNNKENLEKQSKELEKDLVELEKSKEKQEDEIEQIEREFLTSQSELNSLITQNKETINKTRKELNEKHNLLNELSKLNKEIESYRCKNIETNLEEIKEQLTNFEEIKKRYSKQKTSLSNEISENKEFITKHQINMRNLQDNLTLRDKQKQEAVFLLKITKLKEKIGNYNNQSILSEKEELLRTISTNERSINNLNGQKGELKLIIEDFENDLNLPKHKDANKNYMEKLYEVEIENSVVNDLKVYTRVLQNSVLEFHRETMVEINGRLKELWRDIYRGNDVDYIQINAEESRINRTKQTYDYKVVQVKNDIEIDMRGRCSAGQRVLACFIIRLALAELFSFECGILALDEPMINLDKANVESVTLAIANIIKSRSASKNFQLIVISHDEEFMRILKRETETTSEYWSVRRNHDGFSIISKEIY